MLGDRPIDIKSRRQSGSCPKAKKKGKAFRLIILRLLEKKSVRTKISPIGMSPSPL
jgi:hypothetical protein